MLVKDYELLNKVRIHKSALIYELTGEKGKLFLTGKCQPTNVEAMTESDHQPP